MMGQIEVLTPGLLSTIQDDGRFGLQASGFSVSGCMDEEAFLDGNMLLNNPEHAAALEMSVMGGTFLFHASTFFVLTGADMQPKLCGKTIQNNQPYAVNEGDVLELGMAQSGRFTYLCIADGFQVDPVLESCSTNLKCKLGGYQGRSLQKGDLLPVKSGIEELLNAYLKELPATEYEKKIQIRVVKGPQADFFTQTGLHTFLSENYYVSDVSDRMGFRLEGAPIESKSGVDILSDGIVFGSIQVTPAKMPIIMMADRQTTGGYAKIATVIRADLPRLAQAMPGVEISFEEVTVEEAEKQARLFYKQRRKRQRKTGYIRKPANKKKRGIL